MPPRTALREPAPPRTPHALPTTRSAVGSAAAAVDVEAEWARADGSLKEAGLGAKEIKNIFTELRKTANHPLMLLNHFEGSGKIDEVVSVLQRASYYGAEASRDMARRVQVRDESETCGRDVVRYGRGQAGTWRGWGRGETANGGRC